MAELQVGQSMKSDEEAKVQQALLCRSFSDSFSTRSAFLNLLLTGHGALTNVPPGFRRGEVETMRDQSGSFVRFVPESHVPAALEQLRTFVCGYSQRNPAMVAAVLLNGICQIHPFADGNGRVSRVIFNWFMAKSSGVVRYLPLYEIARASSGSFIVKLNRARFQKDWTPLLRYLVGCARLANKLQAADAKG
jgi:hypothetical protein